jgi:hypothetical protein
MSQTKVGIFAFLVDKEQQNLRFKVAINMAGNNLTQHSDSHKMNSFMFNTF